MKISFATTCMGRLAHLQQTLPQNIRDNPSGGNLDIEFVVLNYGDKTGMDGWMKNDPFIREKIEDETVLYAHFRDTDKFHMAHAKNMAHRLATGDVICNLDADNFTGEGFANHLERLFAWDRDIIVNPDFRSVSHLPPAERGFYGRIAVTKDNFLRIGGYSEEFSRWGGDDSNFRRRAKGFGLRHVHFSEPDFLKLISHSDDDRVVNADDPVAARIALDARMARNAHLTLKDKLMEAFTTAVTPVQANRGRHFGEGTVFVGPDAEAMTLGPVETPLIGQGWISAYGAIEMAKGRFHPTVMNRDHHDPGIAGRHHA